ncbi:unnamed protein product [Miscanthus lutarioriparius]|uniref:Uncharacterized protein n=1 Tax=Miscanthus lutarioriparius TaxID=422564 RepID=A0A811QDC2_9POAL|nr:unnamed protein product [Miscanthus lutarioriparius]
MAQQRSEVKSTRIQSNLQNESVFFSAEQELAKMSPLPSVPRPKYSLLGAASGGSRLTGAPMARWREGGADRHLPAGGATGRGRAPPLAGGPTARGGFFFLPGDDGATEPPCRLLANGIGGGGGRRCHTWLGPPTAARDRRRELLGFFCRDRNSEEGADAFEF